MPRTPRHIPSPTPGARRSGRRREDGAAVRGAPDPDTPPEAPSPAPLQHELTVPPELAGQRLDRALVALLPALTRTRSQEAIKQGRVLVSGRPATASQLLEEGQQLRVLGAPVPPASVTATATENLPPLDIVYEDEHILVVNKAPGVVVHPAPGHSSGTLVDALRAHVPGLDAGEDATRPGIVHRLDKDTSGLMVVAKTGAAHAGLSEQMREHTMVKRYLALVEGAMPVAEGAIEAPIGRDLRTRQKMGIVATARGGREARTRFRVVREGRARSLLELQLETGRTHQIRVHLAAVQHPVVGDATYGRANPPQPPRIFLHAAHLEFAHPITGLWLTFDAPLPHDLAAFLEEWERKPS